MRAGRKQEKTGERGRLMASRITTLTDMVEELLVRALNRAPVALRIAGLLLGLLVLSIATHPDIICFTKARAGPLCPETKAPKPPVVDFVEPKVNNVAACGAVDVKGYIIEKETKMPSFVAVLDTATNRLYWTMEIATGAVGDFEVTVFVEFPNGIYKIAVITPISEATLGYLEQAAASRPVEGMPAPSSDVDAFFNFGATITCTCAETPTPTATPEPPLAPTPSTCLSTPDESVDETATPSPTATATGTLAPPATTTPSPSATATVVRATPATTTPVLAPSETPPVETD